MQSAFGRGVVDLASVAHLPRDRCDGDDAPPARAHHVQQQGLGQVEEGVEIDVNHPAPLRSLHARKYGVCADARVVYQHLHRGARQHLLHGGLAGIGIGHVKRQSLGTAARCAHGFVLVNLRCQRLRLGQLAVGVHPDKHASLGQGLRHGCPQVAAGTRYQGCGVLRHDRWAPPRTRWARLRYCFTHTSPPSIAACNIT